MMKPFAIGAAMAAFMLWMLHDRIMGGTGDLLFGSIAFLAAHLAVLAALVCISLVFPKIRGALMRHRPSLHHAGAMLAGMGIAGILIHFAIHGGLA